MDHSLCLDPKDIIARQILSADPLNFKLQLFFPCKGRQSVRSFAGLLLVCG